MATFNASNALGMGFNMSTTDSTGWAFMTADPAITTDLVHDDGTLAVFDVYGSDQIDGFSAWYWSDGYNIVVHDLVYENAGSAVLSMTDLNLATTVADLGGNAWFVTLNGGHDTFYGNDYEDLIRAGYGDDVVYSYDGNDVVYGDEGNDSIYSGAGQDIIYGNEGNDSLYGLDEDDDLYGGAGRDVLNGGYGSDYLSGGIGIDTLTGGAGRDYFVFDTRPSGSNVDRIIDFRPVDDTIMLDNKVFTRLGRDGWLSNSAFTTGSGAHDSSDRIIYNKKTGILLYDPDGIGGASAVKLAQLKAGLLLTKSDFYVL